jgi:hypothetical protein
MRVSAFKTWPEPVNSRPDPMTRSDILSRLRDKVARGLPIVGAGAGTGITG